MSQVADVVDDVAQDVRDNAKPTADVAAAKIEAAAREGGEQVKRVADVASKQARHLPQCACNRGISKSRPKMQWQCQEDETQLWMLPHRCSLNLADL